MITRYWREPQSPTVVRVFFESDVEGATFYVWVDGRLFGSTTAGYLDVPVGILQLAQVDIFDSAEESPSEVFPSSVTLRWEVGGDVAMSRIDQWDGSAWVVRGQVPAAGNGLGRWESAPLADGVVHVFRVVPVDGSGRDGIAREFSGVMCRWPDAPSLSVSVVAGEFLIEDP